MTDDKIKIGDRVLVVSNEDIPIMIGIVIDFEDWGKTNQTPIPIVREEKTKKEWLCMGIMKKYSEKLLQELKQLSYKDRWNKLAQNKML